MLESALGTPSCISVTPATSDPQLSPHFPQSKELPVATMQRSIAPLIQERGSQLARKSVEVRMGRLDSVVRRSLHLFAPVLRVQLESAVPGPFKIKPERKRLWPQQQS
jgi:hypothetical protein